MRKSGMRGMALGMALLLFLDNGTTVLGDSYVPEESAIEESGLRIPTEPEVLSDDFTKNQEALTDIIQKYDQKKEYFTGAKVTLGEDTALCNNEDVALGAVTQESDSTGEILAAVSFFESLPQVDVETTSEEAVITYGDLQVVARDHEIYEYENDVLVSAYSFEGENGLLPVEEIANMLGYETQVSEEEVALTRDYQTCRIIVESSAIPDLSNSLAYTEMVEGTYVIQYATEEAAKKACQDLAEDPNVEYAEPDCIMYTEGDVIQDTQTEDSTAGHRSWGVATMGFDTFNSKLTGTLPEIIVAVIDTGCDMDHSFLQGRLVGGTSNYSSSGTVGSSEDDNGHGTHVAGIIKDCTLSNVKIMPIKVLNNSGSGSTSAITMGIYDAINNGADVINMSLGGSGSGSVYENAINTAVTAGVPVCVAAGNKSVDTENWRPANVEAALAVAALDPTLNYASYSNYGEEVDLCAPGTSVTSSYLNNEYISMSGTSMATPHVAAACAAILSYDPNRTVESVEAILLANAKDLGETGFDIHYGTGMVYVGNLIPSSIIVKTPSFDVDEGTYEASFYLTMTGEAGVQIYYTLDGSAPTSVTGTLYTGPVLITETCTVRAMATSPGKPDSSIKSASYTLMGEDVADAFEVVGNTLVAYHGVLRHVTIPDAVNGQRILSMSDRAFAGNTTIEEVTFNSYIVTVPAYCFQGCTKLTKVTGLNLKAINAGAFSGDIRLSSIILSPSKVTYLGALAFENCSSLTTMNLPKVSIITSKVFSGCTALTTVNIPGALYIYSYAFYGCSSLKTTGIVAGNLLSLGDYAFYKNTKLQGTYNFSRLSTLGKYAFSDCSSITGIQADNLTTLPIGAFQNCVSLKTASFAKANAVGDYAFSFEMGKESTLTQMNLPWSKLQSIGKFSFQGWSESLTLNLKLSALTSISGYAFYRNYGLESLEAPLLTTVNPYAFAYCKDLKMAYFLNVQDLEEGVFLDDYQAQLCFSGALTSINGSKCFGLKGDFYRVHHADLQVYGLGDSPLALYCQTNQILFSTTPGILSGPESQWVLEGDSVAGLEVVAVGFDLGYQWYVSNSQDLSDAAPILGASESTYLPEGSQVGTRYYYVRIFANAGGTISWTDSLPVQITVGAADALLSDLTMKVGDRNYDLNFKAQQLHYSVSLPNTYKESDVITALGTPVAGCQIQQTIITDYTNGRAVVSIEVLNSNTNQRNVYQVEVLLTYEKIQQVISGTTAYTLTYGDLPRKLDAVVSVGDGALTYTSSNPTMVSVSGSGVMSPLGVGTAKILVTAAATDYSEAVTQEILVTVQPKSLENLEAQLGTTTYTYNGLAKTPTVTVNGLIKNKDYTVTYADNLNAGYGEAIITGINNYQGTKSLYFKIESISTSLSGTRTYKVKSSLVGFALDIKSSNGSKLTYFTSNPGVATVSATGYVSIKGAGNVVVTVKSSATTNTNYAAASVVINVEAVSQKVSVPASVSKIVGDAVFSLGAKASSTIRYASDNTQVVQVSNSGVVTIVGPGVAEITSFAIANDKYSSATASTVIRVSPAVVSGIAQEETTTSTIQLRWKSQSGVTGYQVYLYRVGTGSYELAQTIIGPSGNSLTVKNLSSQSSYLFKVRSFKSVGISTYYGNFSSPVNAVTRPVQVKNLSAQTAGSTSITLTWSKLSNISGYQLYRYNNTTKTYTYVAEIPSSASSYTLKNLSSGTAYSFAIRGYKARGTSKYGGSLSSRATTVTTPSKGVISSLVAGSRKITVNWSRLSGSGYILQYSTSGNFQTSKTLTIPGGSITSSQITSLTKGKKYYIRIRGYITLNKVKYYGSWSEVKTMSSK